MVPRTPSAGRTPGTRHSMIGYMEEMRAWNSTTAVTAFKGPPSDDDPLLRESFVDHGDGDGPLLRGDDA